MIGGISFESATGVGATSSTFTWDLVCGLFDLRNQDVFNVFFMGTDEDECKIPNADTLTVQFTVMPPANAEPELTLGPGPSDQVTLFAGDSLTLDLLGFDADNDSLFLRLFSMTGGLLLNDP